MNPRNTPKTPVAPRPAPAIAPQQPAATTVAAAGEQLDAVLRQLVEAHEELLRLAGAQRDAITRADVRALNDVTLAQAAVVQRVAELEQARQAAVAVLARAVGGAVPAQRPGQTGAKVTITQMAKAVADPLRSRILAMADRLRDLLNRLHAEHMALRAAAESLSSHMEGLMRQICRKLSHAGTYARSGVVDTSAPVVTALDVRT